MRTMPAFTVKIKYCPQWQEHTVWLYEDGIENKEARYYTDSKEDAELTAKDMLKRACARM